MAGGPSIAANMAASRTETNVKKAERVPNFESVSKVLGKEQIQDMTATIAENPTVHTEWLVIVFRYWLGVRQLACKAITI